MELSATLVMVDFILHMPKNTVIFVTANLTKIRYHNLL